MTVHVLKTLPIIFALAMVVRVLGVRVFAGLALALAAACAILLAASTYGTEGLIGALVVVGAVNRLVNPAAWVIGGTFTGLS